MVAYFVAFFTGQAILAGKHDNTTLAQPGVLRAVLLSAAIGTVFGLPAYGTGALIRHTAGAITSILGVIFLICGRGPLAARWRGAEPDRQVHGPDLSPPVSAWGEFAVFSGYAVVLLALGAWSFIRRDA